MEIYPTSIIYVAGHLKDGFTQMAKTVIPERVQEHAARKRQIYAEVKEMRKQNYATKIRDAYNRLSANNVSSFKLQQLDNGLIRASNGYYALSEDIETGAINILWARDQKHLLGKKDEMGINRLQHTSGSNEDSPNYVYFVGTVPLEYGEPSEKSGTKPIFDTEKVRNIISEDFTNIRARMSNSMSLKVGDVSDLYGSMRFVEPTNEDTGRVARTTVQSFSNDAVAYTITDTDKGEWIVTKFAKYERLHAAESFPEIAGTNIDDDTILKYGFKNGWEVGRFDRQIDALSSLVDIWDDQGQKIWSGDKVTSVNEAPYTVIRTMMYDAVVKEAKNKENVEEGGFDSAVEIGVTAAKVATGARFIGLTLTGSIVTAVVGGFMMRKGRDASKWGIREAKWLYNGAEALSPKIARHIHPSRKNQDRLRQKLHPDFINNNKILTMDDLPVTGITQNFEGVICADETEDWINRWLATFNNKGFQTLDIAVDDFSMVNICQNGLVRFETCDPLTKDKIIYTTYIEAFDTNEHIALPDSIIDLLKDGTIVRVDQLEQEQKFERKYVSRDKFYDEIIGILESNLQPDETNQAFSQSLEHLCQLFVNPEEIDEQGKLTLPQTSRILRKDRKPEELKIETATLPPSTAVGQQPPSPMS